MAIENVPQPKKVVRVFISSTFTGLIKIIITLLFCYLKLTYIADTEAERNLLMIDVFPYLAHLCQLLGVQFEIVDMRWVQLFLLLFPFSPFLPPSIFQHFINFLKGVREFTNDDHSTYNLCMSELHKCRRESMGPAFFCILGGKYPSLIVLNFFNFLWVNLFYIFFDV
jgi:hypothetical protein